MIRRPPRSTRKESSAASDVYKRQGLVERTFTLIDLSKIEITEIKDKNLLKDYRLVQYVRTFEVLEYEKAILLIDDKFEKILNSGTYQFWKNATSIKISKIDMRQLQLEIAGQELLTKDKAAIRINFYTQYKVVDIQKAILDNKDLSLIHISEPTRRS